MPGSPIRPTRGHARRSACALSAHDCAPRAKATRLAPGARFCSFCFSRDGHSRILDDRHDAAVGGVGRGRSTWATAAGRSRSTWGMPGTHVGGVKPGEPWRGLEGSALEPGGSWHPAHLVRVRRRCSLTETAARLMRRHVRRGRARPGHETGCMDTRVCAAVYRGAVRRVKPEG